MNFASPLFLLGLVAAAMPIVIHLIGNHHAPNRPFAALDFILRCNRRVAQHLKIRHVILLIIRCLLIALTVVIMAKPYAEVPSDLPALSGNAKSVVIIIDDSLSMRQQVNGILLFSRAQTQAQELVTLLGPQADIAVLRFSHPSAPLSQLTRDTWRVRAAISSIKPSYRFADLAPALLQANRLLADSPLPDRHIFVLSDMAKHGWGSGSPLNHNIQFHPVDVAKGLSQENHAVVELSSVPAPTVGPRSVEILARLCNYRPQSDSLQITLKIDDQPIARGLQQVGPWACANKTFHHTFLQGGVHLAMVSLASDKLPDDDQRYLMIEVESVIRTLLINGGPSPIRHQDELFYLQAALQPTGIGGQPIISKVILPTELKQIRLDDYDVVVLSNLSSLPDGQKKNLENYVQRGGGLFITLGENVDPEKFNHSLVNLLPQNLWGPTSANSTASSDMVLRLGRISAEHPIFNTIWSEADGGGLRSARFNRVYRLSPAARVHRKVLAYFDDGSPALIEDQRGQGRILLFTSTIDREWNDLPIRPGYLPLMQQTIRYLSRVPNPMHRRSIEVGRRYQMKLPPHTLQARLISPDGSERRWSRKQLLDKSTLEFAVGVPGFYQISVAGSDGVLHPLERENFAANIDGRESDLRKADIRPRASATNNSTSSRAKQRVDLWHKLGALLLVLLVGESFLIRRG